MSSVLRFCRGWRGVAFAACVSVGLCAGASTKVNFVAPTPEELAMTAVPGHPGVPAVVLNREEVTQDAEGRVLHYSRIKLLSKDGLDYANVVLSFVHGKDNRKITDISGRTIQPDGTIVAFTGQPYEKVLEKRKGSKLQQTVFTLPDVRVGSIIEYSFTEQFQHFVDPPTWEVQGELYVKREHFVWNPVKVVRGEHNALTKVAFDDILPEGVQVQTEKKAYSGVFDLGGHKLETYELMAVDVPPTPEENYTPAMSGLRYGVRFAYTHSDEDKYWTDEGKYWSKSLNHFMPTNEHLDAAVRQITAGAATQEEKLRRIYAAVMALENTEFTRDRTKSENKAADHAKVKEANDVLELKQGTPTALTVLFLAMARSASMEAYAMYVPDRSDATFSPRWLNFSQFSDTLAFVKVDEKERFFDPGAHCAFGQLAWWHQQVQGVRQTADGAVLERTPAGDVKDNVTRRRAELKLAGDGSASGAVDVVYTGAAALSWRRTALRSDEQGFRHSLQESLQALLPTGLVLEITSIDHTQDYEEPLTVHASVSGPLATAAGKRKLVPAAFFAAQDTSPFPSSQRVYPIDFRYPERVEDTVEVKLPKGMGMETSEAPASFSVRHDGRYKLSVAASDGGFTAHREFVFEGVLMPVSEYADVHGFFVKVGTEDHQQVVLKAGQ